MAGWELSAWNAHGAHRNGSSSWVTLHSDHAWSCDWSVEPGTKPGTYRIKTMGHIAGQQPAGWGLSAWNAHGAKRNESSSKVAVHAGDEWPCDWTITPGTQNGTWRITTTLHVAGQQPAGWGLSAWNDPVHGCQRGSDSTWVHVHSGNDWPCNWFFEPGLFFF